MSVLAFRLPRPSPACAVCASGELHEIRRETGGHALMACRRCGVWSVQPQPPVERLRQAYGAAYYQPWRRQAEVRRRMWERRMRLLADVPRGRLLDVGCAEGAFLEHASREGFDVEGTELSAHAAWETATRLGIPVHHGELEDAGLPEASFSVVTLWHVLEHVVHPGDTLLEARRILKPDGVLVVAVPNRRCPAFGAAYRFARGRALHLYHPDDREQHLHHWDPRSLRASLEACGFEPAGPRPDPCALGAVKRAVDFAGRVHSRLAGEPRTAAMVALARSRGGRP